MKTRYKVLLIFLAILLLTYFVGGASALSGLLYVFAFFSLGLLLVALVRYLMMEA